MILSRCVFSWAMISALYIAPCMAQELALDQALEAALNNSPLVSEIDSSLAQREREARDISILPNPELDIEQQFYVGGAKGATDNQPSANLIQPFRLSHLGLRSRVAQLKEEAAKRGKEVELISFFQRVRFSFAHIWLLNERKHVLEDINSKALKVSQFIDQGYKAGAFGRGEQAIFRAEAAKIEAELQGLNSEISRAHSTFISLTGFSPLKRRLTKPTIAEIPKDLIRRFTEGSLKVQEQLDLLSKVASESLNLAERDAFPELRPRLVYAHTNDGGEFYGVGISVPLPFWNRNQNAIHAASAQKQAAEKTRTFYQSDAFKEQLTEIQSALSSSLNELDIYEKKVLPEFQTAFGAFDQQLRAGQGSTLQLWQTLISLNDSSKTFAELWAKTFGERAELGILIQEDI